MMGLLVMLFRMMEVNAVEEAIFKIFLDNLLFSRTHAALLNAASTGVKFVDMSTAFRS